MKNNKKEISKTNTYKGTPPPKQHKYTPEQLLEEFMKFKQERGYYNKVTKSYGYSGDNAQEKISEDIKIIPLYDIDFCIYLGVNSKYLYGLPKKYDEVKETMYKLQESHFGTGASIGDIAGTWASLYSKNKFKYTDKVESEITHKEVIDDNSIDKMIEAMNK